MKKLLSVLVMVIVFTLGMQNIFAINPMPIENTVRTEFSRVEPFSSKILSTLGILLELVLIIVVPIILILVIIIVVITIAKKRNEKKSDMSISSNDSKLN